MALTMFKQIIKWILLTFIGLTLIIIIALHSLSSYVRGGPDAISSLFEAYNYDYQVKIDTSQGRTIRSITTGNLNSRRTIVFLHGAPGSWKDYSDYLIDRQLQSYSKMIAIDRPGYGYSDYGKAEPSIIKQAKLLHDIIDVQPQDSLVLVGFSYGGPVATAYAGLYPEQVSGILLLAPVIAPGHEKVFWFNQPLGWALIEALFPKYIQVANVEKLEHNSALEELTPLYEQISAPTIHMHCWDDWIAPFEPNVDWSSNHIKNATIVDWEGDGHYLPNSKIDTILPYLIGLLTNDSNAPN